MKRSQLTLKQSHKSVRGTMGPSADSHDDFPALTEAQAAELHRRMAELDDPTRYLIVSAFSRKFVLYCEVQSNCYVMNRPADGTLFKSRDVAQAVLSVLTTRLGRKRDAGLQIVTAHKTKLGVRLLEQPSFRLIRSRSAGRLLGNRKSRI